MIQISRIWQISLFHVWARDYSWSQLNKPRVGTPAAEMTLPSMSAMFMRKLYIRLQWDFVGMAMPRANRKLICTWNTQFYTFCPPPINNVNRKSIAKVQHRIERDNSIDKGTENSTRTIYVRWVEMPGRCRCNRIERRNEWKRTDPK